MSRPRESTCSPDALSSRGGNMEFGMSEDEVELLRQIILHRIKALLQGEKP